MSIDAAIERAVECAFQKHLGPLLAKLNCPADDAPDKMNSKEAGRYLGGTGKPIAEATLKFWRCMGHGPVYHKYGSAVRYHKADLDKFMAEHVAVKPGGRATTEAPVLVEPAKARRGRPRKWMKVAVAG